jgi:hypothetical protein
MHELQWDCSAEAPDEGRPSSGPALPRAPGEPASEAGSSCDVKCANLFKTVNSCSDG